MFDTPLYNLLLGKADKNRVRFHMPGHKGKNPWFEQTSRIDFTELCDTDNLYNAGGVILKSEQNIAKVFGANGCIFITCGATAGIFAALSFFAGEQILIDKNCHKSVLHACAALNITPRYLSSPILDGYNITKPGEILAQDVQGCAGAIITSPTYYGLAWDIQKTAQICKENGTALIVDAAHGAHLPFLSGFKSPIEQGADLCVYSPHKTLSALGQGAILLSGGRFGQTQLENAAQIFATSSPSYPIMASLELSVAGAIQNKGRLEKNAEMVLQMRKSINRFERVRVLDCENQDPLRLCINLENTPKTGTETAKILETEHDIVCEMADKLNIVFIITGADTEDDIEKLENAIEKIENNFKCDIIDSSRYIKLPPVAKTVLAPRQALFGRKEHVRLGQACERVSAQVITVYPPGTVICAPGQVIDVQTTAYLLDNGKTPQDMVWVVLD